LVVFVRVLVFAAAVAGVILTLGAALRTVVLPRGVPSRLARVVFIMTRRFFRLWAGPRASFERRDRIMALYGPVALFALLVTWVSLVFVCYMGIYWTLGHGALSSRDVFTISGSAIFTLGFATTKDLPSIAAVFSEASLGLGLLALLITYLPSLYGSFSRREAAVTALEVRAGSPPSGVAMIERFTLLERLDQLTGIWTRWEDWFVEIEETHTSFPALTFFRSPQPDHSWVTAAGAVLDGAAIAVSSVDIPRDVQAEICIRAGYLALRRIADFFRIHYHPDPTFPESPIMVARSEFDQALDRLAAAGTPLKPDRDQAWVDFAGWRVNYDTVLIALAGLTMAPMAPWSSDRGLIDYVPPILRAKARSKALTHSLMPPD